MYYNESYEFIDDFTLEEKEVFSQHYPRRSQYDCHRYVYRCTQCKGFALRGKKTTKQVLCITCKQKNDAEKVKERQRLKAKEFQNLESFVQGDIQCPHCQHDINLSDLYEDVKNQNIPYDFKNSDLQLLSGMLTHLVFRNGIVEDFHAGDSAKLTDDVMKELNKDVNNRIYTLLVFLLKGPKGYPAELLRACEYESQLLKEQNLESKWDEAELNDEVIFTLRSIIQTYQKTKDKNYSNRRN